MRAAHIGHEVIVFHVLSRDEVELPFRDDVEVEDPETGELVLSNGATAAAGVSRSDQRVPRAVAHAQSATYGIDYVRVFTDTPLDAGAARLPAAAGRRSCVVIRWTAATALARRGAAGSGRCWCTCCCGGTRAGSCSPRRVFLAVHARGGGAFSATVGRRR